MYRKIILLLVLLTWAYTEASFALSEKEGRVILSIHNEARAYLNLPLLTWDKKIALEAQKWSDTLANKDLFKHSDSASRGSRGENIYMIASTGKYIASSGQDTMNAWLGEARYYNYASNTCARGKACGHFTQIIWKDTAKIGCGKSTRKYNKTTKIYWVCQYDPPGNYIGERPY